MLVWTRTMSIERCSDRNIELLVYGKVSESWDKPKMTWMERLKNSIKKLGVQEDIALDKNDWRRDIFVDDHGILLLGT